MASAIGVRAACIDIGSNTTRLLVADRRDGRLVEVHQEREFTRLGAGRDGRGRITEAKIRHTAEVVEHQAHTARHHGAETVLAVATAAVREAPNGDALVRAVQRRAGLHVAILSAEEEARLAFLGAVAMQTEPTDGGIGVIDVGGGSSELVVGTAPAGVTWWRSVPIGSGALTERWLGSDPPGAAELARARAAVTDALAGLHPPRPPRALAVGGSATSLSRVAGPVLHVGALERALTLLTSGPAEAVAARCGIDPQRARLLPGGLLILQAAAELLGAELTVGQGGIREGVLLQARPDRPR